MSKRSAFRYFKTSPEVIRLAVMLYIRFPLSLRNVEDLLHERGIDVSHEAVRFWWHRFGPMFASKIGRCSRCIAPPRRGRWLLRGRNTTVELAKRLPGEVCQAFPEDSLFVRREACGQCPIVFRGGARELAIGAEA